MGMNIEVDEKMGDTDQNKDSVGSFLLEGKYMGENYTAKWDWDKAAPLVVVEGQEGFRKQAGTSCQNPLVEGLSNKGSGDENEKSEVWRENWLS